MAAALVLDDARVEKYIFERVLFRGSGIYRIWRPKSSKIIEAVAFAYINMSYMSLCPPSSYEIVFLK
jgi:hypothetical protein